MCILMYFGPKAMPIKKHLVTACDNNPDGFGYAVLGDAGIITGHGMDSDRVIEEFMDVRAAYPNNTAMFHARIATQGSVCMDNCHPFHVGRRILRAENATEVTGEMILGHNGMLPVYPAKGDDRSDTKLFAEEIFMRRFPHLDSDKTRRRLETYLGGSKLVIITTDPAYRHQAYIFNQNLGVWLDHDGVGDIWYSNTSYETYRYRSYSYGGAWAWPSTVGKASVVSETWDDDDAWQDAERRLACSACHYAIVWCKCAGTVKGIYLPVGQVKVPKVSTLFQTLEEDEEDETSLWTCLTCETVGDIDDDGMCRQCGIMFCCNRTVLKCVCWDPQTKRLRTKEERERWDKVLAKGEYLDSVIDALDDATVKDAVKAIGDALGTAVKELAAGPSTTEVRDDQGNLTYSYVNASPDVS